MVFTYVKSFDKSGLNKVVKKKKFENILLNFCKNYSETAGKKNGDDEKQFVMDNIDNIVDGTMSLLFQMKFIVNDKETPISRIVHSSEYVRGILDQNYTKQ